MKLWQTVIIGLEAGLISFAFRLSGVDDALPLWQFAMLFMLVSFVIFYVTTKILETIDKA